MTVDGPGGVGKSTTVAALARLLQTTGVTVDATREPTDTPLGRLARYGTDTYRGLTMACLVAADRYEHLTNRIRPAVAAGTVVVCDRYVASSLVLQSIDGVPADTLWSINRHADRPDLSVFLTGDPDVIARRLAERGAHSRYETLPDSTRNECALFDQATKFVAAAGWRVLTLDATTAPADELAAAIATRIDALHAQDS